jgi:hypothetical protein
LAAERANQLFKHEKTIAEAEGAEYGKISHEINFLRKVVENEEKRKREIIIAEKKTFRKVDEVKELLKQNKLDITDDKKPLTTDHNGHPLLVNKPKYTAKLPNMIVPASKIGEAETL